MFRELIRALHGLFKTFVRQHFDPTSWLAIGKNENGQNIWPLKTPRSDFPTIFEKTWIWHRVFFGPQWLVLGQFEPSLGPFLGPKGPEMTQNGPLWYRNTPQSLPQPFSHNFWKNMKKLDFYPGRFFWAHFWPFLGPKSNFLGAGSKNFGSLISGFQWDTFFVLKTLIIEAPIGR